MKYGCIGEHLTHSFSKEIHAELADYDYEICEVPRDKLDSFMKKADFSAINVTIPYKEAVIPYLSEMSDSAREIGAVNTIVNRGGKLYGYNTDYYGMKEMINRLGVSLDGRKIAVLGTGGTAKTAAVVAANLGAREIVTVSRAPTGAYVSYDELYEKHADIEFLINCTPVGMFPKPHAVPADISRFPRLLGVADAVYNPLNTELYLDALDAGIPATCGLYMLAHQALVASEIFLGTKYDAAMSERVYGKIRRSKENIVLIGMPASGKSTVGGILSARLGKALIDSDAVIEERCGKKISDIFAEGGEELFRKLEASVIDELSNKNGFIIATGGGAVLRPENVRALRRNGIIYFLDRSPEKLVPTSDRPLASSVEQIYKRYNERYEKYDLGADVKVDGNGTPEEVAEIVAKDFLKR